MNYKQRYKEALERAKGAHNSAKSDKENGVTDKITEYTIQLTETIFPELKGSEDEKIRKHLINLIYKAHINSYITYVEREKLLAWLEKQSESNPYSGVSFKYNGHTWGMCARDNGVEILVDGKIKKRVFLDTIQAIREMVNNAKKVDENRF